MGMDGMGWTGRSTFFFFAHILKNIFKTKVDEIYNDVENELTSLRNSIESTFDETKRAVVEQNKQYLLEMNKDISKKIKDLSDTVKNRPII